LELALTFSCILAKLHVTQANKLAIRPLLQHKFVVMQNSVPGNTAELIKNKTQTVTYRKRILTNVNTNWTHR